MTHLAAAHIVLAGGRSCRLNGVPKAGLLVAGRTLLERSVAAGAESGAQVVVGPPELTVPPGVARVREEPSFGGPVAGIAAGLAYLEESGCDADWVLVTACDHPAAEVAVAALLGQAEAARTGGLTGLDEVELIAPTDSTGHIQNLFALYRREALRRALDRLDGGRNVSVRRLVAGLRTHSPVLPDGLLDDVDDAAAAARWGISVPAPARGAHVDRPGTDGPGARA